jgi:hypothetical protein
MKIEANVDTCLRISAWIKKKHCMRTDNRLMNEAKEKVEANHDVSIVQKSPILWMLTKIPTPTPILLYLPATLTTRPTADVMSTKRLLLTKGITTVIAIASPKLHMMPPDDGFGRDDGNFGNDNKDKSSNTNDD